MSEKPELPKWLLHGTPVGGESDAPPSGETEYYGDGTGGLEGCPKAGDSPNASNNSKSGKSGSPPPRILALLFETRKQLTEYRSLRA